jgi:hypothetical protein
LVTTLLGCLEVVEFVGWEIPHFLCLTYNTETHEHRHLLASDGGPVALLESTVIPRLTKIIRSGITFVSRNPPWPKRDFSQVSIENRLIRSECCPLFKDKFYKIVKSTL